MKALIARTLLILCTLAVSERALVGAETGRGVTPADVFALPILSELEVSPRGERAVFGVLRADREADEFVNELWELDLSTSATKKLRLAEVGAYAPRFSPDGSELAWLEDGEEKTSLVVVKLAGGKRQVVAAFAEGISEYAWAPDGRGFAIVKSDPLAPIDPEGDDLAPYVITRTVAQTDGGGYSDERRTHLFWIERTKSGPAKVRPLTSGPWDDSDIAISPDGKQVAFVSNRHPDPDATDDTDVYVVPVASGEPRQLPSGDGPDTEPVWSPEGDRIAYLSVRRANDYYQPIRLATIGVGVDAAPIDVTGGLDAWVASDSWSAGTGPAAPIWTSDPKGGGLLVPLEHRGATRVVELSSTNPTPKDRSARPRAVHGLVRPIPGTDELLGTVTDPTHPPELFRWSPGGLPKQLTHLYDGWLQKRDLVAPEKLVATNPDGDEVEAWLYPPPDVAAGRKYPLVIYIHGGPQGYDGDYFDFDLENQLFPAHGWGVLRVNYRGSTGYGEKFSRALWGDWHRREYDDLMAALDAAIAGHDWIDPLRLGIGGWSYGGIMTLWTVGHTDRFAVGVPERFSFDYLSAYGEDQWWVWYQSELGSPFENEDLYRRLSPGTYLKNVKTPLYLIANEDDKNCPLPQVLQAYQRLKLMGQKTELVIYPGEAHSMSSPAHLVDRLERLVVWFGRHLDQNP